MTFIDRRKNPKSKSLSNRQRFVERAQKAIRESAKKALGGRSINDQRDAVVNIPTDGIEEPRFRHDPRAGEYDYILPGNDEYIVGDRIRKPPANQRNSSGNGGGGEGEDDEFEFALSYDEYLTVIFDDLELPDLIKKTEKNATVMTQRRAGYTNSGMPTNLNVPKTAVAGMARRFALKAPKYKAIHELEAELAELQEEALVCVFDGPRSNEIARRVIEIEDEITSLRAKANAISYLDTVDLRYNNFVKQPKPITQAVMICLMDVSYSMGEREKIIAKKFFILLHLFLKRRYENIDVVFVRHHDKATECTEQEFFTSREGGGTLVSSGYEKIKQIIADRYNCEDWNIYLAQASDGDNDYRDNVKVAQMLAADILPIVQHFTYIEIEDEMDMHHNIFNFNSSGPSNLWMTIQPLTNFFGNITCGLIDHERKVINVFRQIFKKVQA